MSLVPSKSDFDISTVSWINITVPMIPDATKSTRNFAALLPPFLLLISMTCASNIVVMVCTRTYTPLRTISNMYVFSLAVADLVVGFIVMIGMLVFTLYGSWPIGHITCTIWIVLDFSCCTVSMMHLCLIALDRYEALTNPIEYRRKHTSQAALKVWYTCIYIYLRCIEHVAPQITHIDMI